jgi:Protein of unknown function (DUF2846)
MNRVVALVFTIAVLLLSACASGPAFVDVAASIPKQNPEVGRVYIYRSSSIVGVAIMPNIILNGDVVGEAVSGGFTFVDRAPGPIAISTSTEVEKRVSFDLKPGEVRYVKVGVSMGLMVGRMTPELVTNEQGEREIKETKYTGRGAAKSKN